MQFNTVDFFVFLILVVFIFFATPHRFRWILLLAASYYFYMCWKVDYVVLIAISTITDYLVGLGLDKTKRTIIRKTLLFISIGINLGILCLFKYLNFFQELLGEALNITNIKIALPHFDVLLPIGISFYTFQSLSYTIDRYRNKTACEKHLGHYALYVSFFPQLVAGPIERPEHLLPQLKTKRKFNYNLTIEGLKLILWGLFLKVFVADRLALIVNPIFQDPQTQPTTALVIATYCFAFQIYCDFSAYTNIARGSAKLIGINLMQNFRNPYAAVSVRDFWKRWHISLTTWFRDYLYIAMGGNRGSKARTLINILIVFFISGLWHGAGVTFILWGVFHGIWYVLSITTQSIRKAISDFVGIPEKSTGLKIFQTLWTFHMVCIGWIVFRANSFADMCYIFSQLFRSVFSLFLTQPNSMVIWEQMLSVSELTNLILGLIAVFIVIIMEYLTFDKILIVLNKKPLILRWVVYLILTLLIFNYGVAEEIQFVYFQF